MHDNGAKMHSKNFQYFLGPPLTQIRRSQNSIAKIYIFFFSRKCPQTPRKCPRTPGRWPRTQGVCLWTDTMKVSADTSLQYVQAFFVVIPYPFGCLRVAAVQVQCAARGAATPTASKPSLLHPSVCCHELNLSARAALDCVSGLSNLRCTLYGCCILGRGLWCIHGTRFHMPSMLHFYGCKHHGEGPQRYPQFAPCQHRACTARAAWQVCPLKFARQFPLKVELHYPGV